MTKFKKVSLIILAIVLVMSVTACGNKDEGSDKVIAEYSGGQITQAEFDTYLGISNFFEPGLNESLEEISDKERKNEILQSYLESYIGEKYLSEQIEDDKGFEEKANYTLQIYKEQFSEQLGSDDAFKKALTELNVTEDDLYDNFYRYFKIEDYFIKEAYEEDKEQFSVATVSHILISNEGRTEEETNKLVDEVMVKLGNNEDFAEVATEYSDDLGSKEKGGMYEDIPVILWVKEFMEASISLPLNQISEPVKTDYGYHIIMVTERNVPALEEISGDARNRIFSEAYYNFIINDLPGIIEKIDLSK